MPPQGDLESSVEVDPAPAAKAKPLTSRQAFLQVFPGVMVAMFLAAADQTILASALPTIAGSLGGLADLSWVVIAYLLAATIAAPRRLVRDAGSLAGGHRKRFSNRLA